MTRIVTRGVVDGAALEVVLRHRDGFVLEEARGQGRFVLVDGPLKSYQRTVATEHLPDGRWDVTQVVEFQSAMPYWSFLFRPGLRLELGRLQPRAGMPWWAPPDRFDARATRVLAVVCAAALMGGYLATLMTQTATFASDEFGTSNTAEGWALAATRAAAILTLPIAALADRRGRRVVAGATAVAGPLIAATGALAPSLAWLAATQTLARGVVLGLGISLTVLLAEEMPASSRAYAISLVSMAGALGVGFCLLALPLADVDEHGWRLLYVLGLLWLPLALDIGRRLPESKRFAATHRDVPLAGHGRRFWLLAAAGFLIGLFGAPASQFQNEFLRNEIGFSAARITLFITLTNTPGAIGIIIGGRLAETRGRRRVAAIGLTGGTLATVGMYSSVGWEVWALSVTGAIIGAATVPALGVYGPELFPTSLRGRVNGIIAVVSLLGSVIGLVTAGLLSDAFGEFGPAFALLALGPLALAVLVLVAYPETAHHTLEELNPEDAPSPDRPARESGVS